MSIGLLGKKVGMTRVFTENGQSIPVTVLKIETNVVSMIKNIESDGYNALQMSSVELKENKVKKPHLGHFKKNNIAPQKNIKEFRVEDTADIEVGQKFEATHFEEGTFVNVRSRSKGKGFAGTIKGIILKEKMLPTATQFHIEPLAQLVNVNSQVEFSKEKKWQVKWAMKWLQEKIFK